MLPGESESENEDDDTNKKVSDDASLLEEESLDGGKSGLDRHPYIPGCQTIRDLHGEEFMRVFFNVSIYCFGFALDHRDLREEELMMMLFNISIYVLLCITHYQML